MTTLIFDWSELLGQEASGTVRVRATRWRHEPETLVVPWSRDLRFTGREVLEVDASLVLSVEWRPDGVASSLSQTLMVPAEGEHLAHLLAVDPSTLEPLEGDDLVTAVDLMARAEALTASAESGAETARDWAGQAERSASGAAEDAATASTAATDATLAADLSRESALSVLPMVAGATVADTTETTVTLDLGMAVNTVPALITGLNVILADVTTPDGRTNPDGLGTLLQVEAGADLLVWPGGTVVHGRPPEGAPAFASVVRVGGVVHVVWSVVDQTPPPTGGGAGAVQVPLRDLAEGAVTLPPGGSAVATADDPSEGGWIFTNVSGRPDSLYSVLLTAGRVVHQVILDVTETITTVVFRWAPEGNFYVQVTTDPRPGPWTTAPAVGSGVVLLSASLDDLNGTPGAADLWWWRSMLPSLVELDSVPGDPTSDRWLALRVDPDDPTTPATSLTEWGLAIDYVEAGSPWRSTPASGIKAATREDHAAVGIGFPARLLTPEQMAAHAGTGPVLE